MPTAYACGRAGSQWGLFRSLDMGQSWARINPDTFQFPAGVKTLAADRNVFGRVFVGSGGVGIAYVRSPSTNRRVTRSSMITGSRR